MLGAGRAHLERGLELARGAADPEIAIAALNNLARDDFACGELGRAEALLREALELCVVQGDLHHEAALRNNLADVLHHAAAPRSRWRSSSAPSAVRRDRRRGRGALPGRVEPRGVVAGSPCLERKSTGAVKSTSIVYSTLAGRHFANGLHSRASHARVHPANRRHLLPLRRADPSMASFVRRRIARDPDEDQREHKTHLRCADAHSDEWVPERVVGDMWRENELTLTEHVEEVDRLRREWNERTAERPV